MLVAYAELVILPGTGTWPAAPIRFVLDAAT